MLKYFLYLLVAIILVSLAAGGVHLYKVAQRNQREMKPYEGEVVKVDKKFGKVLVVYYSLTGHTKDIARRIQKFTGADTYEIKTAEKINAWPWFYLNVKGQLKSGNYPVLAGEMPDFEKYDLIFWGAPVWWYTIATPGLAFLEQADFALDQFLRHTLFGGSGLFLFDHLLLKRLFGPGRGRLLVFFEQHGS